MKWALPLLLLSACSGDENVLLVVDVRTDFVLGPELASLELVTLEGPDVLSAQLDGPQGDGLAGLRLLDGPSVPPGRYHVRVAARRPDGTLLAETESILSVQGDTTFTILLTRDCAGAECPAEDPALAACVAGRCETPECAGGDDEACENPPECLSDADCDPAPACGTSMCLEGACVVRNEGACGEEAYCEPEQGCRIRATTTCDRAPYRDAILCLDFEDAASQGFTAWENDGATLVDSRGAAFDGEWGLQGIAESGSAALRVWALPEPLFDGSLYLQARIRVRPSSFDALETLEASGGNPYLILLDLRSGDDDPDMRSSVEVRASQALFQYNGPFVTTATGSHVSPPDVLPADGWACVELELRLDATDGEAILHADGEPVSSRSGISTLPPGGFERLVVRVNLGGGASGIESEVFIDDVVLSRSRLGCQ